jgi:spore coat polysaccharide biosynthesis protein SpsF
VTALDLVPEGTAFEIFTLAALQRCHELGGPSDREHIANYARFHQSEFAVEILHPAPECQRLDLRLTVDNPEDLILCRAVFHALGGHEHLIPLGDERLIPLAEIIAFLDSHPELTELVRPFVDPRPTWEGLAQAGTDAEQGTASTCSPDHTRQPQPNSHA